MRHLVVLCLLFTQVAGAVWAQDAADAELSSEPAISAGDAFLEMLDAPALFGEPRLSPDGRRLAYIRRPDAEVEQYQLIILDLDAAPGTGLVATGLGEQLPRWLRWASNERLLLSVSFEADIGRSARARRIEARLPSRTRIVSLRADLSEAPVVLFGQETRGVNARNWTLSRIVDYLPDDPDHILMPAYRNTTYNLWRVNLVTGDAEVYERGTRRTRSWYTIDGVAVMRVDLSSNGRRMEVFSRSDADARWERTLTLRQRDVENQQDRLDFEWAGETGTPGEIYVRAQPEGSERIGIHRYDLETGAFLESVAEREDFDIYAALVNNRTGEYLGYGYIADRYVFHFENDELRANYNGLLGFFGDQIEVSPTDFGGSRMVVRISGPTELGSYYLYDFDGAQVEPLFPVWPQTFEVQTFPVEAITYAAADGLEIQGFLTWPDSGAGADTPLIVFPHGGPEARDRVVFDDVAQYLATQGYAVFQPNFRGSSGYGDAFREAGHREWGAAMQTDIHDGVRHLINAGRVDPNRICIMGFSYGGYAALMGAAQAPDLFKCAIAGGSVTDLDDFIAFKAESADWVREYWVDLLGEPENPEELALMQARSPVNLADQITIPVLLFHGDNDSIVPVEQSRAMAEAMEAAGGNVTYLEEAGGYHTWGWGEGDFEIAMRNVAAFLADGLDGDLASFEPEPFSVPEDDAD